MHNSSLSTLSVAILGLISQRSMSGYDLKRVFTDTPMGQFSASPGAIYPALKRLATAKFIDSRREAADSLRPREVYSLTKDGKTVLATHLTQPVTLESVTWKLDELILGFAFMRPIVGKKATLLFLNQLHQQTLRHAKNLQSHLDASRSDFSSEQAFALKHGIAKYKMNAQWAKKAGKELSKK